VRIAFAAVGQPSYVAPRPPKPPVSGADIAISIIALVLTVLMVAAGAVFGLLSLAFLDHCPPESCSAEGAASAVVTALMVAFGIGVVGLIVTAVQLVRRKPGWPFAVCTLALCFITFVIGGVAFDMAVS
jgi:cytochrome bd-type quinol oxidase subunit 2